MNQAVTEAELKAAVIQTPAPRRSRRKPLLVVGALILAAGAGWYGLRWWQIGRFIETTDDAYVGGNVTPLSPQVSGLIEKLLVTDNQHVTAGQPLMLIDDRPFKAALDHAEAALRQQQSTLVNLKAQLAQQNWTIVQAKADLDAKNAAAVFAEEDAKRYALLASSRTGSQQDAQKSAAADGQARATVAAARAALGAAKQQLEVLDSQIAQANAAVSAAEADVETARLNLGYTVIRSPIDGIIGNRLAQAGIYVSPGSYLLTIVPSSGLWVDANFKEDQIRSMKAGEAATVFADIAPDVALKGHVASLGPATGAIFSVIPPQNATGNFTKIVQRVPIRIMIDPDQTGRVALRPGLSTVVSVDTRSH